jgi:hypothetical protein
MDAYKRMRKTQGRASTIVAGDLVPMDDERRRRKLKAYGGSR